MRWSEYTREIVLGVTLSVLLFLLINPFDVVMLGETYMLFLGLLIAAVLLLASVVWKEHIRDEREEKHHFKAAHFSYIIGVVVLGAGIVLQSLMHTLDVWLGVALIAMLFSRISASTYYKKK